MIDGRTGGVGWRQGTKGFVKDYDGDPTAMNHTAENAKKKPHHKPRMGKRPMHQPRMGSRPMHQAGQSSNDSDE